MKFSIECKVESRIELPSKIIIKEEEKEYIFIPDRKKLLSSIKIVTIVKNQEKFYSIIKHTPDEKVKHHMTIKKDSALFNSLIKEFQELESILAFNGNLKRIYWDEPKEELVCETQEEKQKVQVFGTRFTKNYPDPIRVMEDNTLKNIIKTKDKYSSLTIPKAFWREANNDFKAFRYINSFFNFYFILEGLYGNRKTRNNAVEKEFLDSKEFCDFVNWMIESTKKEPRHLAKINQMLKLRNKKLDIEGIIHLLVSIRGDLHHFTDNPNKKQGTPFDHAEFETITWVSLGLATRAILQKILEINTGKTWQELKKEKK